MLDLLDGKDLYKKVDLLRTARKWSIYELAQRAGVSAIIKIEENLCSWHTNSWLTNI